MANGEVIKDNLIKEKYKNEYLIKHNITFIYVYSELLPLPIKEILQQYYMPIELEVISYMEVCRKANKEQKQALIQFIKDHNLEKKNTYFYGGDGFDS